MSEHTYSPALRQVLKAAQQEAIAYGTTLVTTEHLLCGLIGDPTIRVMLKNHFDRGYKTLQKDLEEYFDSIDHEQDQTLTGESITTFEREIVDILEYAQDLGGGDVTDVIDLFNAIVSYSQSPAALILRGNGIDRPYAQKRSNRGNPDRGHRHARFIAEGIAGDPETKEDTAANDTDSYDVAAMTVDPVSGAPKITYKKRRAVGSFMPRLGGKYLQLYCSNLNALALEGKISPAIGRGRETDQMIEILGRQRKNNPLLVGESGVGKTAIAEDLAFRIITGDVPSTMKDMTVHALDLGRLLAGTTYRGDFEERIMGVLDDIRDDGNVILLIDEIHMLVGLGAGAERNNDASNFFKPALQRGELRCIGTTTYDECRKYIQPDKALARRFQRVEASEPSTEQTLDILKRSIGKYEEGHKVTYTSAALKTAVTLGDRYFPQLRNPDKVFDIIDSAGSRKFIDMQNKASLQRGRVTASDITACVARMKNAPLSAIRQSDRDRLRNLELDLKSAVFDQDDAAVLLADAVRQARVGLNNPEKPVGSFLFHGPTGVGKTEMARQLAATLGIELIRFDMSEFMEKHSVARLIGAPPGYVGFDQGGLLTEAMDRNPRSVLLLDEIEKAHPDIFNVFLQAMDNGIITDNNGKKVDFRHCVIIMTTNAGSTEAKQRSIGFSSSNSPESRAAESVARMFTAEFRNRLDATISFKSLAPSTIEKVAEKFLLRLAERAKANKITLTWTDDARGHLARIAFDPDMGARPMERTIKETIGREISNESIGRRNGTTIVPGKLENGGTLKVDFNTGAGRLVYAAETRKLVAVKCSSPSTSP